MAPAVPGNDDFAEVRILMADKWGCAALKAWQSDRRLAGSSSVVSACRKNSLQVPGFVPSLTVFPTVCASPLSPKN